MNAIIYCRVSTTEQAFEGNSLASQERLCRGYAKNNAYTVDKIFIEEGESAKTVDRTQLKKMMEYCKLNEGKIDALLIYKIDRLSRNSYDYASLKTFFISCKVKVISITEPIEDNPLGRFIEHTLSGIAQLDNEIRGERSKNGMIEALKQGRWTFQAPYGFKTVGSKGNSNIEPLPELEKTIRKVFNNLYKGFNTIEEVRQLAKSWGLTKKNGKALTTSHFHKMLRNPVYKGWIDVPSMGVYQKGDFKAIAKPRIFDQVQVILDGKKRKLPIYKKLNPDFPLRGTLRCHCGKYMTASWAKKNQGYYRCTVCKGININKRIVEPKFKAYLEALNFNSKTISIIKEALILNWESHRRKFEKELANIEKRKAEIKHLQDKVVEKNMNCVYSDKLAKSKLAEFEKELVELNLETIKYSHPSVLTEELLNYSLQFLTALTKKWEKLGIVPKHKLQKILFPDGIVYLNGNLTTPVKSCIVELNELVSVGNSTMVSLLSHRWNTFSRISSRFMKS